MSITAAQRAALNFQSRPPGSPSMWYAIGTSLRALGKSIDAFGVGLQGECATIDKLPIPSTAVKLAGKAPSIGAASFVAPSANLIGAVTLGEGASAWYGSMVKGAGGATAIGELSAVGDRAVVVDSVVGKGTSIGAGAILTACKVGNEASVGMGCIVGKGATLGDGAALAAGSVLPPGTAVPAKQLWAGRPAKYVGDVTEELLAGVARTAEVTQELAKIHAEEAWKEYAQVELDHADWKREKHRTQDVLESMREDPKWIPLPSLGEQLARMGVHSNTYTPP